MLSITIYLPARRVGRSNSSLIKSTNSNLAVDARALNQARLKSQITCRNLVKRISKWEEKGRYSYKSEVWVEIGKRDGPC